VSSDYYLVLLGFHLGSLLFLIFFKSSSFGRWYSFIKKLLFSDDATISMQLNLLVIVKIYSYIQTSWLCGVKLIYYN